MMSAPAVNSVLPTATATPLPLNISPVKVNPPSPVSQNHNLNSSPVPLSLVHENKTKTPEKPKEATTTPTSNGIEESPVVKEPVVPKPQEEPVQPTAALTSNHTETSSTPTPADSQPDAIPAPNPAAATAPAPAPVPAPPPAPVVTPTLVAAPIPAPPPVDVSPAETPVAVAEAEVPPSKPTKTQGAKRRREPTGEDAPPVEESGPEKKPRRTRAPVHHYQSPLPEIITVINRSLKQDNTPKPPQEKLVIFYKNEFLAVRNSEGGFFLCQTVQNIFRSSHRIRIRWLSMDDKATVDDGEIYTRDFYDTTDFECILTNVTLKREDRNKYKLPKVERERVENILKRGLEVEQGVAEKPSLTEDHPDGIDISLFTDESQLKKSKGSSTKRLRSPSAKPRSPKKAKNMAKLKEKKVDTKKVKSPAKSKAKSKKPVKKLESKPTIEKVKSSSRAERSAARDRNASFVDPLKVSPPNEKARMVTKILRKIDSSPATTEKKLKKASKKAKKAGKSDKAADKVESKKGDKKKEKSSVSAPAAATSTSGTKKSDKKDKKGDMRRAVATRKGRK